MDSEKTLQPPPYSKLENATPESFLAYVGDYVGTGQSQSISEVQEREVARVKNFMIFVLSMDYQCNPDAALSAADRDHFTAMQNMLIDLQKVHGRVMPSGPERHNLASYFWTYLHEPCKELHLPVECVLAAVGNFTKFLNVRGRYKGSCFGLLQMKGLPFLAQKLYVDRSIVVPRLIDDPPERMQLDQAIDEVRAIYFHRIAGIEGSTMITDENERKWQQVQNVSYEANQKGRAYESQRNDVLESTLDSAALSLNHIRARVGRCIGDLVRRSGEVDRGERDADSPLTWRGSNLDFRMWPSVACRPWHWTLNWANERSQFLPDFFENRWRAHHTDA